MLIVLLITVYSAIIPTRSTPYTSEFEDVDLSDPPLVQSTSKLEDPLQQTYNREIAKKNWLSMILRFIFKTTTPLKSTKKKRYTKRRTYEEIEMKTFRKFTS